MITVNSREEYLREVLKIIGSPCNIIELGVLRGDFSEMIYNILRPNNLTLIDPFEIGGNKYEDGLLTAYSTENEYEYVKQKFESEKYVYVDKRYSFDAVHSYEGRSHEFIYIDASHLYEDVKRDLNDWRVKLKKGGIIGLHDYFDMYGFGVVKAVDEFCKEHDFEIIIYNNNGYDVALKQK